MAHYALVNKKNVVVQVFVGRDEDDLADGVTDWETHYTTDKHLCLRTSYNTRNGEHLNGGTPFRGTYAGIGYTYDPVLDEFVAPPEPSDPEAP